MEEKTTFLGKEFIIPNTVEKLKRELISVLRMLDKSQSFINGIPNYDHNYLPNQLRKLALDKNEEEKELILKAAERIKYLEDRKINHGKELVTSGKTIAYYRSKVKEYELPLHEKEPHMGWGEGCDKCLPWPG